MRQANSFSRSPFSALVVIFVFSIIIAGCEKKIDIQNEPQQKVLLSEAKNFITNKIRKYDSQKKYEVNSSAQTKKVKLNIPDMIDWDKFSILEKNNESLSYLKLNESGISFNGKLRAARFLLFQKVNNKITLSILELFSESILENLEIEEIISKNLFTKKSENVQVDQKNYKIILL